MKITKVVSRAKRRRASVFMIVYLMSLLNKMFEPLVTVAHYETPLHPIKKVWWIEKIVNGLNSLSSM